MTTNGQVVIPQWLRKQYQIEAGTRAIVIATVDGILLKPVTAVVIERGFGLLKRKPGEAPLVEEWVAHKRATKKQEKVR
ncbi:MAG: AbrB/MazE/SpoVT family DNA-binding domain-containing protein [Verrucomicrobiota bacterium]